MYLKPSIQNINSIKNLNKIDSTAILILQNGKFFRGLGLGYQGTATGEVCFNTSITGYQEIISDPSYAEQIINFTFRTLAFFFLSNFLIIFLDLWLLIRRFTF